MQLNKFSLKQFKTMTTEKHVTKHPVKEKFKVQAPGYSEQFSDRLKAVQAFEKLKRSKIRNRESFSVKLFIDAGSGWSLEDEVKISSKHYEE